MSGRTWAIADPHFGHRNICAFSGADGTKLRPWDNPNEMDDEMRRRWNELVDAQDRIYVLGDVVINRRCLSILPQLKGRKVLVKGNHDIFKLRDYLPHFDDIRAYVVGKHVDTDGNERKYILSHIPLHPDSVGRFGINIHGHIHDRVINDPRYVCVSVEHTGYAPILLQDALKMAGPVTEEQ